MFNLKTRNVFFKCFYTYGRCLCTTDMFSRVLIFIAINVGKSSVFILRTLHFISNKTTNIAHFLEGVTLNKL
jgi:hypothetical protein